MQGLTWFESVRYSPDNPADAVRKTAITFDPYYECLWTGNEEGRVSSYLMPSLDRHVSFKTHVFGPIKQLDAHESGIISLGMKGLRLLARSGLPLWNFEVEKEQQQCEVPYNFHCMINPNAAYPQQMLLAGEHSSMSLVDVYQGKLIKTFSLDMEEEQQQEGLGYSGTVVMRKQKLICCGQMNGKVVFRDPNSLKIEHTLVAHSGALSDVVISNQTLVTCGFSHRNGQLIQDPILRVYDLRMFRALAPITFPQGAYMLHVHPKIPNVIYVITQAGHFQSCDLGTLMVEPRFYQVDTSDFYCTTFDMSSTGNFLCFGVGSGGLHVWANHEDGVVNSFSHPVDDTPKKPPQAPVSNLDDETPLSVIGMPYYDEPLLSVWPNDLIFTIGRRPPEIPPEILATVRYSENVAYAPNPGIFRRNQQYYRRKSDFKVDIPKFRSEQERENDKKEKDNGQYSEEKKRSRADGVFGISMPKSYRKVEIKYSRFGVEDFDFGFYNKTRFGGLETHISNSYSNSVLQMWNFNSPLKKLIMKHVYSSCSTKLCLICELGFLFKMLDDSKGVNCHSSNFLRALRLHPKAASLEILETDGGVPHLIFGNVIQRFNAFLLQIIHEELRFDEERLPQLAVSPHTPLSSPAGKASYLNQITSSCIDSSSRCPCGNFERRSFYKPFIELNYPKKRPSKFSSILASSIMNSASSGKSFCGSCRKYQNKNVKRELAYMPPVMMIHCNIQNEDDLAHWRVGGDSSQQFYDGVAEWLPHRIAVCVRKNEVFVQELTGDLMEMYAKQNEKFLVYDLTASVCQVLDEFNLYSRKSHFVSCVRFPTEAISDMKFESPDTPTSNQKYKWVLFNDFLVSPRPTYEATQFNCLWKVPCILQYTRVDIDQILNENALQYSFPWPPSSVLVPDMSKIPENVRREIRFEPLSDEEISSLGSEFVCALDAEFVMINPEETEVRSDGTRSIVRPSRQALARLSIVRGEGPNAGLAFIDDYILMNEAVYDYLTAYSGITMNDLIKGESNHYLTDLKSCYKKLRTLVDLGCKFIGHGLKSDFRTINIVIPPSQVIDTVNIYHMPKQRNISLRFLAFYLQVVPKNSKVLKFLTYVKYTRLGSIIQGNGHCSIEDAQTALSVYQEYEKIVVGEDGAAATDRFRKVLEEIYAFGRKMGWSIRAE